MTRSIIISLSFVFILASCGKYEDGPAFSLRSKEQRVANQWKVTDAQINGVDLTPEFNDHRFVFDRYGNAEAHIYISPDLDIVLEGDWEFEDNEEVLSLELEGDSLGTYVEWRYDYTIIALKEAQMKLVREADQLNLTLEPF